MAEQRSLVERIARLDRVDRDALIASLSLDEIAMFGEAWCIWARHEQLPPAWHWNVWLILAGRGFGKTRAGAEWVHRLAEIPGRRIALIGPTESEARGVMVEGSGGLLSSAANDDRPVWEPTRGVLTWPTGSKAFVYSGANPESLRGPEHDFAWCDELAKWAQPEASWDMMTLGLRRGERPQALATTTPRQSALLRRLIGAPGVAMTRGKTTDNCNLAQAFIDNVQALYGGTRLGRQEIDGELIEDVAGAVWSRETIEASRVRAMACGVRRVVIGVDPPAGIGGDACGIVVVALGADGFAYVIEDASVHGLAPEGWAGVVAEAAARHGADKVVAEANNGGAMVASVLRAASSGLPVRLVHATQGKVARAEPVEVLYASGRAFHAGSFPELEDEMCGWCGAADTRGRGDRPTARMRWCGR